MSFIYMKIYTFSKVRNCSTLKCFISYINSSITYHTLNALMRSL